ncbi:MAG: aminomethyl-transferring glycine dehydrogenase subunit GcvPA [Dehalococcoidia bacterium]|nr:aminomethyl-transferring glycine dehydrogenase subunit GcvPA [Dehalococcoidia bacterium]
MASFSHPYLPQTDGQRREMLAAVGVSSEEELFQDIPAPLRNPTLKLPPPLTEMELVRELRALAEQNAVPGEYACFLGGGASRHFIPSVVGALISRGEFTTPYTPYQPEVSQGTLQATYEFQSFICQLTGMEVANAGMYDGASALTEAALMACRATNRYQVVVLDTVNPRYLDVVNTYTEPQRIRVRTAASAGLTLTKGDACLLVQSPNFFGSLEDLKRLRDAATAQGAMLVVSTDLHATGLFKPPGDYGADIVVGECQPTGVNASFGGPYVGFFTCKEKFVRQMPGRIVGRTVDLQGRTGYVLTLQPREQHIRRERATSNICTSEALVATAVAMYLAVLGKHGFRQVAELCYHKAHYAASRLAALPGFAVVPSGTGAFFNEFVLRCPVPPARLNRLLLEHRILGGLDISAQVTDGMLLCVTETNSRDEIERLVRALSAAGAR